MMPHRENCYGEKHHGERPHWDNCHGEKHHWERPHWDNCHGEKHHWERPHWDNCHGDDCHWGKHHWKKHRGEKPLNFIRSIPADGCRHVSPLIRTITLVFDRNVCDHSVWMHNRKQIQVWEGMQRLVPGRDYRLVRSSDCRKIFIKPIGRLAANTEITIAIYPHLMSRTCEKLCRTVIIKFRTGIRRRIFLPIEE